MGGKSKPTIGYWYRYLIHFGISQVLDALLEFRGGEKTAWAGRAEGGTITIDARELWGGEKAEGGIEGELDVMLGHADQVPSARLAAVLGDQQSAYRNRASVAFEGLYGAFNPYPKAPSFKGVRILKGWEDDTPWYPEKAAVLLAPATTDELLLENFASGLESYSLEAGDWSAFSITGSPYGSALRLKHAGSGGGRIARPVDLTISRLTYKFNLVQAPTNPGLDACVMEFNSAGSPLGFNPSRAASGQKMTFGLLGASGFLGSTAPATGRWYSVDAAYDVSTGLSTVTVVDTTDSSVFATLESAPGGGGMNVLSKIMFRDDDSSESEWLIADMRFFGPRDSDTLGMNPAHILYDSLVHSTMQGLPADLIDEASFLAAADLFYSEGFGLCTKFNPVSESVEAFQQRICNVVGANLARSRVDGKYYLAPARGVHDLEALPVLEDDDILEYEEEPSDPIESVNQVAVEWFDPVKKKKHTTTPVQSLGAIQSAGGVIAEVASYPEIPTEALALRVAARDLAQKSAPLKRFRLTTNRVPYAWRAGEYFRLQAPRRGISDMVCIVGEIDAGTPRSGSMRLVAIQDVSSMPLSVYVEPEPGVDTSPSQIPQPPEAQQLLEAPYVELAGDLPAGELEALADDAGFVLAVASRPESGLNYTLFTAAAGETLTDRGAGDWCPTALVVEAGVRDPGQTEFTLEAGLDLSLVEVGTAALWGTELVRVDAIDASALTVTLGRGCGDTTPQLHAASERIWFYDIWAASDRREYAGGEAVSAKLRTRTSSQLLDAALAPTLEIALDERAVRPYPPGGLKVSDDVETDVVDPTSCVGELTVTWVHRDRLLQADQLVDASAAGIGPEPGTTYTVRYYLDDVLDDAETGISGTASSPYVLSGNGLARVEVEAVRDGYASWQAATAEFDYLVSPPAGRITDAGDIRFTDAGDRRVKEY